MRVELFPGDWCRGYEMFEHPEARVEAGDFIQIIVKRDGFAAETELAVIIAIEYFSPLNKGAVVMYLTSDGPHRCLRNEIIKYRILVTREGQIL